MIKLIVSSCGYVESGCMSVLFWKNCQIKPLTPTEAIKSLSYDLITNFREYNLLKNMEHIGCNIYKQDPYNLNVKNCLTCKKTLRLPFFPEEFVDFLFNLHSAVASAGPGEHSLEEELENWWPWVSYTDTRKYKPEEILLVEENFEKIVAWHVDENDATLSDEEKSAWQEYKDDYTYGFIINQNSEGFWEVELKWRP